MNSLGDPLPARARRRLVGLLIDGVPGGYDPKAFSLPGVAPARWPEGQLVGSLFDVVIKYIINNNNGVFFVCFFCLPPDHHSVLFFHLINF